MDLITKKKILSLYPGQPRIKVDYNNEEGTEKLILKNLAKIKDNEVYTLWVMCLEKYSNSKYVSVESQKKYILELWNGNRNNLEIFNEITPIDYLKIADYLRSNGYAIPAFGYTVEQLKTEGLISLSDDTAGLKPAFNNMGRPAINKFPDNLKIIDSGSNKKSNHIINIDDLLKNNRL